MVTVIPKVINSAHQRSRLPIFLYILSITLSCLLIYWGAVYCFYNDCNLDYYESKQPNNLLQYFPVIAAPIVMLISLSWLISALYYQNHSCTQSYNFMEMPSAVFCSLLSGVSAVIEIHFSINVIQFEWIDQSFWTFSISVVLCLLHAMIAFALQ